MSIKNMESDKCPMCRMSITHQRLTNVTINGSVRKVYDLGGRLLSFQYSNTVKGKIIENKCLRECLINSRVRQLRQLSEFRQDSTAASERSSCAVRQILNLDILSHLVTTTVLKYIIFCEYSP